MVITKTPFRISFIGGGTDYPIWYKDNPGAVLATSIDKYCWITMRYLPPYFDHKFRIVYSRIEDVKSVMDIQHPAVRETLKYIGISEGIEMHHDGDIPARSGMGTSSSFTVGLLHALYALNGMLLSRMVLAREAIHIEQDLLKENVGSQDQVTAAIGGFNRIDFGGDTWGITPIVMSKARLLSLQDNMMLFFTGLSRTASEIAGEQIRKTPDRKAELSELYNLVGEATKVLTGTGDIREFGLVMDESWKIKRRLTDSISSPYIDFLCDSAKKAGADGCKLLGAGGGGFVLVFANQESKPAIKVAMKGLLQVPFKFDTTGTQVVFHDD